MDHNRNPRNYGCLQEASHFAEGFNPLCGDQLKLYLYINDSNTIEDVSFEGQGCAISTASASIMTEILLGLGLNEAKQYFHAFCALAIGENKHLESDVDLGKLEVLKGVSEYPARVKCATLAWHTLQAALKGEKEPAKTE